MQRPTPTIELSRKYIEALRQQAKQINDLANSLEQDLGLDGGQVEQTAPAKPSPAELVPVAQRMFSMRRKREKVLPTKFLGEPAWDLLLHLFERTASDQPVSITKASYAAHVPPTTALRAITMMENEGFLYRTKPKAESRNVQLLLTDNAMDAMCSYLQTSRSPRQHTDPTLRRFGGAGTA